MRTLALVDITIPTLGFLILPVENQFLENVNYHYKTEYQKRASGGCYSFLC